MRRLPTRITVCSGGQGEILCWSDERDELYAVAGVWDVVFDEQDGSDQRSGGRDGEGTSGEEEDWKGDWEVSRVEVWSAMAGSSWTLMLRSCSGSSSHRCRYLDTDTTLLLEDANKQTNPRFHALNQAIVNLVSCHPKSSPSILCQSQACMSVHPADMYSSLSMPSDRGPFDRLLLTIRYHQRRQPDSGA